MLHKFSKKYNDMLLSEDGEKMNKILQDSMLRAIKSDVEEL